jgi:hypothetical protein
MYIGCLKRGTCNVVCEMTTERLQLRRLAPQAGSSQTTTKVTRAACLINVLDDVTEPTNTSSAIRLESHLWGREMPWLSSRRSRPIQQALLRRSPFRNNEAITDMPVRGSDSAAPGNGLPVGTTRVQLQNQA